MEEYMCRLSTVVVSDLIVQILKKRMRKGIKREIGTENKNTTGADTQQCASWRLTDDQ